MGASSAKCTRALNGQDGNLESDPAFKRIMDRIKNHDDFCYWRDGKVAREWCAKYSDSTQAVLTHPTNPSLSFSWPYACVRVAVKLPDDFDQNYGQWPIAYHGTGLNRLASTPNSILSGGFKVDAPSPWCGTVRGPGCECYGKGVYATPSFTLAKYVSGVHKKDFGVVLQLRLRPGSFARRKSTFWSHQDCPCLEWASNDAEWVCENPQDVVIYGLLFFFDDVRKIC